jgi:putative transposase
VAGARLVLWSAQGLSNSQIARRLHWRNATVGKWRQSFIDHRLAGLYDELRPGRPRTIEKADRAPAETNPGSETGRCHPLERPTSGSASGISKSTVHRLFQTFALHRTAAAALKSPPTRGRAGSGRA